MGIRGLSGIRAGSVLTGVVPSHQHSTVPEEEAVFHIYLIIVTRKVRMMRKILQECPSMPMWPISINCHRHMTNDRFGYSFT